MSSLRTHWAERRKDQRRATELIEGAGGIEKAIADGYVDDSIIGRDRL